MSNLTRSTQAYLATTDKSFKDEVGSGMVKVGAAGAGLLVLSWLPYVGLPFLVVLFVVAGLLLKFT